MGYVIMKNILKAIAMLLAFVLLYSITHSNTYINQINFTFGPIAFDVMFDVISN